MQELIHLDRQLFRFINYELSNPLFDAVMPLIRHANFSVPLYVFLLIYALSNFSRNVLIWALMAGVLAGVTNYVSSDLIKENIFRLRPCNDLTLSPPAKLLLGYKPQSSSFTSSHATNHFGLAVYFFQTLKHNMGKYAFLFFAWSALIIFAQVYVGVHFPLDVLSGAVVGSIFGYIASYIVNKNYSLA